MPTQVLGPGAFQEVDLSGAFGTVAEWSQPVLRDSKHVELMNLACKNALLQRDVDNLRSFFGRFAPELLHTEYGHEIWDLYHAGKEKQARELFMRFLLAAVLERRTGYVLQKEILRRRGIFKTTVMRNTRKFSMDAADLRELDGILEMLRPHYRV